MNEYEAIRDYTLTYNEDCLISLYTDQYEYTGGAHGNTVRSADTWLLPQAERLTLGQLFPADNTYLVRVELAVIDQIEAQNAAGTGAYFDNYRELVPQTFNPAQFYLTPEGLTVYFQQYDIAPYASGIPRSVCRTGKSGQSCRAAQSPDGQFKAHRRSGTKCRRYRPMRNDCRRRRAA